MDGVWFLKLYAQQAVVILVLLFIHAHMVTACCDRMHAAMQRASACCTTQRLLDVVALLQRHADLPARAPLHCDREPATRLALALRWSCLLLFAAHCPMHVLLPCAQVARGRAIIPANKRHLELEPTIVGKKRQLMLRLRPPLSGTHRTFPET
jgi:hypothetical protein